VLTVLLTNANSVDSPAASRELRRIEPVGGGRASNVEADFHDRISKAPSKDLRIGARLQEQRGMRMTKITAPTRRW
jgi:hypothetical protein